ncbi:MAG TPA: hybrid sensor histidine kinase/response regulator [Ktedonobacterales bacterium]|nr:hybrid sensor histidine kinase/response regulator [Ktedonobacterales bacterium]
MSASDQVNILMVDDQPAKLLIYETILADLDVNLIKATSARQALRRLLQDEIAIVLVDVSMPEMDGFELAAMIRQHPRFQKTAIIFVSAVHLTDLDRLKGYEVGAVDYLPVPVIPEILRAKVSAFADLFRKTRQLEALNRELERRVEERTAALEVSMRRERDARLAAEAAARARDEFLSVAAHELKTPVTGLRATAQLIIRRLRKGQADGSAWLSERLSVIDQQSERLARLVEQLLDVSRLDRGAPRTERAATDLATLAEKLVAASRARATQHTFVLAAAPGVVADVDPIGIEQVMSNLLDNAIKYSPQGGQIDIEARLDGANRIRLAVRDRGIGIPKEKRADIFERFYRAHSEEHRSGLGLGLYISQQIVESHSGKIAVEFPSDGGTRFIVDLPVKASVLAPIPSV